MLLIGGFTIASALSKTAIDRVLITRVLSIAGERPSTVLLAFMGVACFASMWISNVAAPTLCFTLIQVRLKTADIECLKFDSGFSAYPENSPTKILIRSVPNCESFGNEYFPSSG